MTTQGLVEGTLIELTYMGKHEGSDRKLVRRFLMQDGNSILSFDLKLKTGHNGSWVIGGVYAFAELPEGRYRAGKFLRMVPDGAQKLKWTIEEETMMAARSASREDPLDDMLRDVRRLYQNMPNVQRSQLLAKVVYHITRPGV